MVIPLPFQERTTLLVRHCLFLIIASAHPHSASRRPPFISLLKAGAKHTRFRRTHFLCAFCSCSSSCGRGECAHVGSSPVQLGVACHRHRSECTANAPAFVSYALDIYRNDTSFITDIIEYDGVSLLSACSTRQDYFIVKKWRWWR